MAEQTSSLESFSTWLTKNADQVVPWTALVALLGLLTFVFWPELGAPGAYSFWDSPKYSHGWLVPIFTLILLWMRYEPFGPVSLAERWAGAALISAGVGLWLLFTISSSHVPEMDSFVPTVAGVFLLVGGWKMFRWAGPAVVFLIFMFPLPGILDRIVLGPLQKTATNASTYCLQTIGIPAYREGNTIVIGEMQLGVVEACSGLRMLTIFFALAVAVTLVTQRPIWERVVIIVSAVPIAVIANVARITVTAILHLTVGPELVDKYFHALDGWLMMPLALGLLYVEFEILSNLVIEEGPAGPLQIGGAGRSTDAKRATPAGA